MSRKKFLIPEPSYTVVQREDEGATVYAAVNTPLAQLTKEQQQLFGWQFSLIMNLDTEDENGMTSETEASAIEPFCQQLTSDLQLNGNAMPLARITWRKTRELLFRVYNPVVADELMQKLITDQANPRPFSYTIDPDDNWEMATDYLSQFRADKQ